MRPLGPCPHLWESSGPPSTPGGSRRGHGPAFPGDPPLQEPLPLGLMIGVRGSWAQGSGRAGGHVPGALCPGSPQEHSQWKPYDRHPLHQAEVRTRKTGCRQSSGHGAWRAVCAPGSLHFPTVCLVSHCFLLFQRAQTGFFANPHLEGQGLLQFAHRRPKTTCTHPSPAATSWDAMSLGAPCTC